MDRQKGVETRIYMLKYSKKKLLLSLSWYILYNESYIFVVLATFTNSALPAL